MRAAASIHGREPFLHLRNLFLLAADDLRAQALDPGIVRAQPLAHEHGARMMRDHRTQELRVAYRDLLPDEDPE